MLSLLRRPDIRLAYWFADRLNYHKYWFPCDLPRGFRMACLDLPESTALWSKWIDPRWRRSYPWTLLRVAGPSSYRMVYFRDHLDEIGMQTIFPITTEYVAMRIGDRSASVAAVDDGKVYRPEQAGYEGDGYDCPIIADQADMKRLLERANAEVTFI